MIHSGGERWYRQATLLALMLVNGVYLVKYSPLSPIGTLLLFLMFALAFWGVSRLHRFRWIRGVIKTRAGLLTASGLPLLLLIALALVLTPGDTTVNRERALIEGLGRLYSGQSPYGGSEMLSGMPGLLIIVAPLERIGQLGLLTPLAYLLLLRILQLLYTGDRIERVRVAWLSLLTLPLVYEALVHSELFFNMTLVVWWSVELYARRESRKSWYWMGWGLIAGLLLTTRGVTLLPMLAVGVALLRLNQKAAIHTGVSAMVGSTLILLPVILLDSAAFTEFGPFSLQMRYIPPTLMVISLFLFGLAGMTAVTLHGLLLRCGFLLLILIGLLFALSIAEEGLHESLFGDRFDIGYFTLPIPFLLAGVGRQVDFAADVAHGDTPGPAELHIP